MNIVYAGVVMRVPDKLSLWHVAFRAKALLANGYLKVEARVRCVCLRETREKQPSSDTFDDDRGPLSHREADRMTLAPGIARTQRRRRALWLNAVRIAGLIFGVLVLGFAVLSSSHPSNLPSDSELNPEGPKTENLSGTFIEFFQAEFAPDGKAAVNGLNDSGLVYVPKACAEGETCFLHVVLHGCEQSTEVLGGTFYKSIGTNEWADTNGIVSLYPQARSVDRTTLDSAFPNRIFRNFFAVNPNGCWNWRGYAYDERFALKAGAQIGAIHGMIKRIMGTDAE